MKADVDRALIILSFEGHVPLPYSGSMSSDQSLNKQTEKNKYIGDVSKLSLFNEAPIFKVFLSYSPDHLLMLNYWFTNALWMNCKL